MRSYKEMAMEIAATYKCTDADELAYIVALGNPYPQYTGPVVALVLLWDGKIARCEYYNNGPLQPELTTMYDTFLRNEDMARLRPLVNRMVAEGKPFIIETGDDDMVGTFRWSLFAPMG